MLKIAFAVVPLLFFAHEAGAQSFQAINNCRQLVDGADRVACYDALEPADMPKVEPAVAAKAQHPEQSCGMLAMGARGVGNCEDGDIAQISNASGKDVPDIVAGFCDFGSQILTLPDPMLSLSGEPKYVVLCKYHQRAASSKKAQ